MTPLSQETLDLLPHKPPFRFLTSLERIERAQFGEALWRVTGEEDFLKGHFPSDPIVPGVLIIEALAQLSGLVAILGGPSADGINETERAESSVDAIIGRLAHMECRFYRAVTPPAEIRLRSKQHGVFEKLHQFEVEAAVGDVVVAKGRLTLVLTPRSSTQVGCERS